MRLLKTNNIVEKYIALLLLFLLGRGWSFSQEINFNLSSGEERIYQIMELDSLPVFKGGYDSLLVYIDRNLIFPTVYEDASIQGRVICQFVITEEGDITAAKVIQGIDECLDNEVLKIVSSMPRWLPGKINNRVVKTEYFLPVICVVK